MSWSDFSNREQSVMASVALAIRTTILARKQSGAKVGDAIEQGALALGVSPRWARSIFYGEPCVIRPAERIGIMARWSRHLDTRVAAMRIEAEKLERIAEQHRVAERQLTLDLGDRHAPQPNSAGVGMARAVLPP